ncbi:peroxisome biogenesis protein 1 isoform X2 [Nymphaea colorata]|uniref:peroxisome biogenesis protein 1 isoform X2 n=1 Tax=Nymphaea colorata TaxID=210225 RepID=UPI00129E0915|nr:peroxisome biogenesis protein 1 isoform X2 [Nymphaea colorata]
MEVEVRPVGGLETCFVSLPLPLIHTLQSTTSSGFLPPILALELRPLNKSDRRWHVAWSGSASQSAAIEVAQQLAESIGLPSHAKVQVRAIATLPRATGVTIEPVSEDDWEVLELNSEFAEETILKQVGVVYEGMKFPLWLHSHTVVLFVVISALPKQSIVQLVPGTEVVVAPKTRKKNTSLPTDLVTCSLKDHLARRALMRVQELDQNLIKQQEVNGFKLRVVPTSLAFIHPETARTIEFCNSEKVILTSRVLRDKNIQNKRGNISGKKSSYKEANGGSSSSRKKTSRHLIVRLVLSDSAAKGHVMLPWSVCSYLQAEVHSWLYVKKYDQPLVNDIPNLNLSPCWFKLSNNENSFEANSPNMFERQLKSNSRRLGCKRDFAIGNEVIDWSLHERLLATLPCIYPQNEKDVTAPLVKQNLIWTWITSQLIVEASSTCQSNTADFGDSDQKSSYELSIPKDIDGQNRSEGLELLRGKLCMGKPVSFDYVDQKRYAVSSGVAISSLHWMEAAASEALNRIMMILSPFAGKLFNYYNLPFPGHVLLYGPPGSGKTLLASAVAKHFEDHKDILAHVVFVSCSKLAVEKLQSVRQGLANYISEALDHSPSLVIFDDLDNVLSSSSEPEASPASNAVTAVAEFLSDIIDEFRDKRKSSCGIGPVAFMATARSLGSLPKCLTSSGRFDFHLQLSAPAAAERGAILKHELHRRALLCSEDVLEDIAAKCDGYDAYDLEILVDRAVHAAVGRVVSHPAIGKQEKAFLIMEDFLQAMNDFLPVAMRDITKPGLEGGRLGWEDVGGLSEIQNAIQEMIELPSMFPNIFKHAPLRLRSNVLLYGPPGCGKTHIVGAAAAACKLRFVSVKGPELLNKYIGASEQAVRDIFSKASISAPCLLFFDEFDSIAPKRGHDNTGVTDRVVNQLLTELDGVEALTGVFVFAATSRPDLLDAALLRPGRLDRLLFCDFPSKHERLDILKVLSRKLPMASDVDLDAIASVTDGFSGADLQAVLSDAQLASVHKLLESMNGPVNGRVPVIDNSTLRAVALKARPSVSQSERQRLYGIYSQFLESKKSVGTQSRDAKGKRATLA